MCSACPLLGNFASISIPFVFFEVRVYVSLFSLVNKIQDVSLLVQYNIWAMDRHLIVGKVICLVGKPPQGYPTQCATATIPSLSTSNNN